MVTDRRYTRGFPLALGVNVSVKVSGPTHCRAPPPTPSSSLSSVIVCIRQASDSVVGVRGTNEVYVRDEGLSPYTCFSRASLPPPPAHSPSRFRSAGISTRYRCIAPSRPRTASPRAYSFPSARFSVAREPRRVDFDSYERLLRIWWTPDQALELSVIVVGSPAGTLNPLRATPSWGSTVVAFREDLHSISLRRAAFVCHRLSLLVPLALLLPLPSSLLPFSPSPSLASPVYPSSPRPSVRLLFSPLVPQTTPSAGCRTFFRLFVLTSSRAGNRRLAPRDTHSGCPVKREILWWRVAKRDRRACLPVISRPGDIRIRRVGRILRSELTSSFFHRLRSLPAWVRGYSDVLR